MEIKVTIDATDELKELLTRLIKGAASPKQTKQEVELEMPKEAIIPEQIEVKKEVDYESLRAEIRKLGAEKKAEGKDVVSVIKSYGGGKVKDVPDSKLIELKQALEAL